VGLRAQGVGEGAHRLQFAAEGLQIGVVSNRHHPAHGRGRSAHPRGPTGCPAPELIGYLRVPGRFLTNDEHPTVGEVDLIVCWSTAAQQFVQARGQAQIHYRCPDQGSRLAGPGRGNAQQARSLVVVEEQGALWADQHQPLTHGAQNRVVVDEKLGELLGAPAQSDPVEVASQKHRGDRSRRQQGERQSEHGRQAGVQCGRDAVRGRSGGDEGTHDPGVVENGYHRAHRRAQRARADFGQGGAEEGLVDGTDVGLADLA